jgi:hypothetical protein
MKYLPTSAPAVPYTAPMIGSAIIGMETSASSTPQPVADHQCGIHHVRWKQKVDGVIRCDTRRGQDRVEGHVSITKLTKTRRHEEDGERRDS